jgi:hypothetical protein
MFIVRQGSHDPERILLLHPSIQRAIDPTKRSLQITRRLVTSEPYANLVTLLIDPAHHSDLFGLFVDIVLIDTYYSPASESQHPSYCIDGLEIRTCIDPQR